MSAAALLAAVLHFHGAVATRYLYAPSLRREVHEYLYLVGVRATAYKSDDHGLALQAQFTSFDTRRALKGFQSTGWGNVDPEPVLNFNNIHLDGYTRVRGHRLGARFGLQPLELPTFQLPLRSVQVAQFAGLRAELDVTSKVKLGALSGNFVERQTQEVHYKIEGIRERWNYANGWGDVTWAGGQTRAGFYHFSRRIRPYVRDATSLFVQQETPLFKGTLTPRLYVRYMTGEDLFADVVASVEAKVLDKMLWIRPGYIYVNRDPRNVPLPNSNYFTPGRDHNMVFLHVESPLPRASDSIYACLTTGADRFMARQGTRFETGVFLRFAKIPGLP